MAQGLKVREILGASEPGRCDPLSELLWRAPLPSPPDVVSLLTLNAPTEYQHRRRMEFFECNHPDAVGYLVACNGYAVCGVAVHKRGENPGANLYEELRDRYPHWMYMPVDEGEYITHISRHLDSWNNFNIVEMGLVVGPPNAPSRFAKHADPVLSLLQTMVGLPFSGSMPKPPILSFLCRKVHPGFTSTGGTTQTAKPGLITWPSKQHPRLNTARPSKHRSFQSP